MSNKKKWAILSLIVVVVIILVLLLIPAKGKIGITADYETTQKPNLETFLNKLFVNIKDSKGQTVLKEVLGKERYESIALSKGNYALDIVTDDGVLLKSESVDIPWGNFFFKPRTQEVRFTIPEDYVIRPEDVSIILEENQLRIKWKNTGWSKKASFQVSMNTLGSYKTESNELSIPIENEALVLLDNLRVSIGVLRGESYETIYKEDLPVNHFKGAAAEASSPDKLDLNWEHEKGLFNPTGYRILIDGKEYKTVGPSATSETIDLEALKPQPNAGKRRESTITVEALVDGIVLSRNDRSFYMYETIFVSTLSDEWLIVQKEAPLSAHIKEIRLETRLENDQLKAYYISLLPEEAVTVEYTAKGFPIVNRSVVLAEERETETVVLPLLSRVYSAQAESVNDERLTIQWNTDHSEEKINPTYFYVETPGATFTTKENAISIPYEAKEQEIKIYSVFFDTVFILEKTVKKTEKPSLTLIRIDYDYKEDIIFVEGYATITAPFTVLYRVDRYIPEESAGLPEERAGLTYEVSNKEWIVIEDVVTSEGGTFSFFIPVKDLQALPPLEQPLKINGAIEVLDFQNQSAMREFEVVRFLPPTVEFCKFFINDKKLLLEWKPEDPNKFSGYSDFAVNVTTTLGESFRYGATDTRIEIDLSTLKDNRLTLTLEALWKKEIVQLDDLSFEFLPMDFNGLVDWNLEKSGKETWKIVYLVKHQKGYESVSFQALDQQQQEILKKNFDAVTGSFEWPVKAGKTYLIRVEIKYDIETNKDSIAQTVTTQISETNPPSIGGIKEVYQIAQDKIRLEAIDSAPGMEYYWTITNKNNERYSFTAFSPVYDGIINRKDGLSGIWSVHLRAVHGKTNTVFSETKEVYTMKADDYLYEDIAEKQEKTIKTNNGFVSRTLKIHQDGILRIIQSRLKFPPKTGIYVDMGTLYLEEDTRLNVLENENNELWEGVYCFGGRVYTKRAVEVSNAAIAFQLYNAEASFEDTSFLASQKGIVTQGTKVKVLNNCRFTKIGTAITTRNSELTVENTFMRDIQEGFLCMANKWIRIHQINLTGITRRAVYISTSKDVELSSITVDGGVRGQQEGFDIRDSAVIMRNITLKNLRTGMVFVNADASLDYVTAYQVIDGIYLEYSFFELKNSTVEADNLGIYAVTSPILRTKEFPGFLPSTGKVGSFAGLISKTRISAAVAVKIERGENHIAVENSQLNGEITHGGIQVNPNGMPYHRGEIIQK
ncbi:MAG: hypothetical protein PHT42_05445 [Thermotogota bacterium]|nr:hypothetical protein [Thermotogota bacterium]